MSLGSIKIDVGADLSGLSIAMDDSLSLLDKWSGKVEKKTDKLWETFSQGFGDSPLDLIDQFGMGFDSIGAIIDRVDSHLGILPEGISSGVRAFGDLTDKIGDSLGLIGDLTNYSMNLTAIFPALGTAGSTAFSKIGSAAKLMWSAIIGPVGIIAGAVTGLFYGLYKGLEMASDGVKKFVWQMSNKFPTIRTWLGGMKQLDDWISKVWSGLNSGSGEQTDLDNALSEISDHWQKVTNISELDKLRSAIALTTEEMSNKFLAGDYKGANKLKKELQSLQDRMKSLQEFIKPPEVESEEEKDYSGQVYFPGVGLISKNKFTQLIDQARSTMSDRMSDINLTAPMSIDKSVVIREVETLHDTIARLSHRKHEIILEIDNAQSIEATDRLEGELSEVNRQLDNLKSKLIDTESQTSNSTRQIRKMWEGVTEQLNKAAGSALSFGLTNLFDGADKEVISQLNEELEHNQRIRKDISASKEEREAAKSRIEIIQEEIQMEKRRGNVVLQTASMFINAARDIIQAKLAEAIASAIAGEAKKGLIGLISAGVAVAGITALFNSKVPKLADGGVLDSPTLFLGGEYPGASHNKEIVTPQKIMSETFRSVLQEHTTATPEINNTSTMMSMATIKAISQDAVSQGSHNTKLASDPVRLSASIETKLIGGGDLYGVVKLEHEKELRTNGNNPFIDN